MSLSCTNALPVHDDTMNSSLSALRYDSSETSFEIGNATKPEMFAYMSYMDDTNQTSNKGICSFGKMRSYADIAEMNGICEGIRDKKHIYTKKSKGISNRICPFQIHQIIYLTDASKLQLLRKQRY